MVGPGRKILAGALLAAVIGGACSSAVGETASNDDRWRVVHAPFRIDVLAGSRVITSVGGAKAQLTYQTKDGAQHQLTQVVRTTSARGATTYTVATDQASRTASVSIRPITRGVRVTYALSQPASVAALGFTLAASPGAHFLGTGQRVRWVDMRKTAVPLKVWNNCSSSPSGLFVSNRGFGGWIEATAVGRIAFPDAVDDSNFACDVGTTSCSVGPPVAAVRVCLRTAQASFDVVRGTIPQVLRLHAAAQGFPRRPWLPQFELIKWRDRITSAAELFDDIHQLRSRRLPIGWILLDNPWETGAQRGCYGALTFDPAIYPNPRKLIDEIHALGLRFMLWISPQIRHKGCSPPSAPDGYLTGNDEVFVRDLTNPGERRDFTNALRRLVDLGVDGFKGDRGDEVNLEPDELTGGPGTLLQNAYTRLYAQAAVDAFAAKHGASFGSLYRSFGYGAAPLLPGAVGPDEPQTSNGLAGAIRAAQTAGIAGATVWGSDVGGYSGGELTAGLFVRWAQFAALTPIFEVGGAGANAKFWELGTAAVAGLRQAATLHYELVPYLYELATEAHTTALPVIRPLGLGWPDDSGAWRHDLELTVGTSLLAAPVVSPSAHGPSTSAVYLPAGTWTDVFNGRRTTGPVTIQRTSNATDFPLYVRAGSALPFNFRTPIVWRTPWRTNDTLRPDRQGWLISPRRGATTSTRDRATTLELTTNRAGTSRLLLRRPRRDQQFLVYSPIALCGVTAAGRPLPRVGVRQLPGRAGAWAAHASRSTTYVIKASVRAARLALELEPCGA